MNAIELLAKRLLGRIRRLALRVEKAQQPVRRLLKQLDARLIVRELNVLPGHAFFHVQLLLRLENAREEELLQFFVGEVDAQLLERVMLKVLEAKDVEQTDVRQLAGSLRASDVRIDLGHDPVEHVHVNRLDERVARHLRLCLRVVDHVHRGSLGTSAGHFLRRQSRGHARDAEQRLRCVEPLPIGDLCLVVFVDEGDVAKNEQPREQPKQLLLLLARHAQQVESRGHFLEGFDVIDAGYADALGLVQHVEIGRFERRERWSFDARICARA